jgi:hypothetical protein
MLDGPHAIRRYAYYLSYEMADRPVCNPQGWHLESACGKLSLCQSLRLRFSMTKPKSQLRGYAPLVKLFSHWTV